MVTPIYSTRLNLGLKARLEAIASSRGRTLSYIIDAALTEYANQAEPIPPRHAYLYVLTRRSDGRVKIGMSKHPEKRTLEHNGGVGVVARDGVEFEIFWQTKHLVADAPVVERRWKELLGGKHRGIGSGETFSTTPERAVKAAYEAMDG